MNQEIPIKYIKPTEDELQEAIQHVLNKMNEFEIEKIEEERFWDSVFYYIGQKELRKEIYESNTVNRKFDKGYRIAKNGRG